ncbi:MAG: SPOR domain-containing protein [Pseudomonadota bacterium]
MATYFDEDTSSYDDELNPMAWGAMMNWAGAVVSLALIAGLGVWGYQLLVRDVSGVPVVRALDGPMRIAPEDPGGMQAEYQELTVTRVASDGAEEAPVEQVVLAPPPVALTEEDQPVAALIEDTPPPVADPAPVAPEVVELTEVEPVLAETSEPVAAIAPAEPEEAPSAIEAAIAEALAGTAIEPAAEPQRVSALAAGSVARSPRPAPRPAVVQNALVVTSAPAATSDGEVAVEAIPAGTRLVQLGAYPSAEEARAEWTALEQQFGAYFEGKSRVVQEAAASGSSFYRLRAMGFNDLSDARRFCAVLVAENANCIPVIRR